VPATFATTREEIEVYRFHPLVSVGVPVAAVLLQAFLPVPFPLFRIFDLPLLVTIYFAVARRRQAVGLFTGSAIGLLQDSLTHQPLGLYGIAKTVIGYLASSIGVKIDVENPGSRLLIVFGFYLLHQLIYLAVARGLAERALAWQWGHQAIAALANALLAVLLFSLLDKLRQRA